MRGGTTKAELARRDARFLHRLRLAFRSDWFTVGDAVQLLGAVGRDKAALVTALTREVRQGTMQRREPTAPGGEVEYRWKIGPR